MISKAVDIFSSYNQRAVSVSLSYAIRNEVPFCVMAGATYIGSGRSHVTYCLMTCLSVTGQ